MRTIKLEIIKEAMFEAMSEKTGKSDLYWIDCLFNHELTNLKIQSGELHTAALTEKEIYTHSYDLPKAQLFSPEIPEDYSLFVLGPEKYKKDSLKILCATPIINSRDHHEYAVLSEIEEHLQEMMLGKHKSVKGKLYIPRKEDWKRNVRVLEKSFPGTISLDA